MSRPYPYSYLRPVGAPRERCERLKLAGPKMFGLGGGGAGAEAARGAEALVTDGATKGMWRERGADVGWGQWAGGWRGVTPAGAGAGRR